MTRFSWSLLLVALLARSVGAVPYTAPTITGRADASCLGAGNPKGCCTAAGVGNCITDTDFVNHTTALQRVDALLRSDLTQSPNFVLAGPPSGGAATPTWRALVPADVPAPGTLALESSTLTNLLNNEMLVGTGTGAGTFIAMPSGGTNGCAGATTDKVLYNSSTHALSCGVDQTGGAGTFTGLTLNGDTGTQPIANADTFTIAGGNGMSTIAGATDTVTVAQRGAVRASATVCAGTSDAAATASAELAAATTAGKAYFLPSGCVVGLGSPGAGGTSISVPSRASILCEDPTAGFRLRQQRCTGGVYAGAACNTDAECVPLGGGGSGTCDNDFGTASANPCTGSECYAPTFGSVYTVLKDTAQSTGITIQNCTFWVGQADAYQRCGGSGGGVGDPCRQECDDASTYPGGRCEVNGDCGAGTCLRRADCNAGGGTCSGAPKSLIGAGKVNVLDLNRTSFLQIDNVRINDHLVGDFGIGVDHSAVVANTNIAGEATNCTSPFATPAASLCFGILSGTCCYGAHDILTIMPGVNVQPTTAVTDGIVADTSNAEGVIVLRDVIARGATTAIKGATAAALKVQNARLVPPGPDGPGTDSAGIVAPNASAIYGLTAPRIKTNGVGVTLSGGGVLDSSTIGALQGTTGAGVVVTGDGAVLSKNVISSGGNTGVDLSGNRARIALNAFNATTGNVLKITAGVGHRVEGNDSRILPGVFISPTVKPIHVALFGSATVPTQMTFATNYFQGGWRGFDQDTNILGLQNTNIVGNRFVAISGATSALSGAGTQFVGNYTNGSGQSSVCDASCSVTPGRPCTVDADCGTCTATFKCIPEPAVWIGTPNLPAQGTAHWASLNNIWYSGTLLGQCGGTTTIAGQLCDLVTCSGSICTAGTGGQPATCVGGGGDAGKRCCLGAAPTCANRQPWDGMRLVASSHAETTIANNSIFTGLTANFTAINFNTAGVTTGPNLQGVVIGGNNIYTSNPSTVNGVGVMLPAYGGSQTITNLQVSGNQFWNLTANLVNPDGRYGPISFSPRTFGLRADMTTASTTFVNVAPSTGAAIPLAIALEANRSYYYNCEIAYTSSATTTGIGFGLTGPTSPTLFAYLVRIPTASIETGAGTDNMNEEEGRGNDGTDAGGSLTPSTSVGAAGTVYTAAVRGNIITTAAGNLTLRVKASNATSVTVKTPTNCAVTEIPL